MASSDEEDNRVHALTELADEEEEDQRQKKQSPVQQGETFATLRTPIDRRLTKAVMKCGFVRPTEVQKRCLPLALQGKDLLVRARTGSGKTMAYLLPLLQKILVAKQEDAEAPAGIRGVVLVPTRELVAQVHDQAKDLVYFCRDTVRLAALAGEKMPVQEAWLQALPDVVVATPGRLAAHIKRGKKTDAYKLRESVETLVVDEADLIFSFGYADDVGTIVSHLPKTCQSFLMSATLNADVKALKKLVLHSPVTVRVEEAESDGKLAQWYMEVPELDKDVLLFALLRLELLSGKKLFFVRSVERCYRLKLLLEQFHVRAAVLNAELPMNSRLHILQQFNKGVFDNLICTDDSMKMEVPENLASDDEDEEADDEAGGDAAGKEEGSASESDEGDDKDEDGDEDDDDAEAEEEEEDQSVPAPTDKKQGGSKKRKRQATDVEADAEFGVARGVDFKGVSVVINVDFPESVEQYTHRIGRTARGGATGTALTIVTEGNEVEKELLDAIQREQTKAGEDAQPAALELDMEEIGGFRYRVRDVAGAVTAKAVRDARLREVKKEMLNSERLKAHFEDNPVDLALLQHDMFRTGKVRRHMATIPAYLLPDAMKGDGSTVSAPGAHGSSARGFAALAGPGGYGHSTAGRIQWKKRKRKGQFRSAASSKHLANKNKRRGAYGRSKFRKDNNNNPLF